MFRNKQSHTVANVIADKAKFDQLLSIVLPDELPLLNQTGCMGVRRKRSASARSHVVSARF
ncbi:MULTISPECIES: hypothetical protein [Aliagarivorans]|uniref:hypothetical protein n=1 Tax=Aliagarivorans TaxID=882379 RepID=UPI000420A271|nr:MULTISPECIES: hypothetical protein [Aliagarivorans]